MSTKMTSEVDALKTNEFLRRRKLRIQQVREQSKDIAKKIRLRANAEKFKYLVNLDATKGREYLEQQDKLIKKLEELHARSLGHLGASHKNAAEVTEQESKEIKVDLSKKRAREAAAELRRQKQEKLDERKKLLDRKLQAREIANEISREKSSTVANKFSKTSVATSEQIQVSEDSKQANNPEILGQENKPETTPQQTSTSDLPSDEKERTEVNTNDMGTQWDYESMPNEWEPHVSKDAMPKDTLSKNKNSLSDKSVRPNLFALSDEMPSDLRGGLDRVSEVAVTNRPSLTLVSDYIQNRELRLRDFDSKVNKKPVDDLKSIKETILRARASRGEGSVVDSVHVADVHVVPVPSWRAESGVTSKFSHRPPTYSKPNNDFKHITDSEIDKILSTLTPKPDLFPTPVLRGSSPFRRNKVSSRTFSVKSNKSSKPTKVDGIENLMGKKDSVTIYDHLTRDVKDVPCGSKKLVSRDHQSEEDAYCQALKEASLDQIVKEKEHHKKLLDMRSKIAMTKQSVEKEYKDTMAFFNSLPKDKSHPIKNAFKDAQQEAMQKENRQRKLQHEFRKIQKECRKQAPMNVKPCSKTKCPIIKDSDEEDANDFDMKDLQYSWMPVPESDEMAVHIIPTKIKKQKDNAVKFSKIDCYHEYRSRHKHTPPTKDTCTMERSSRVSRDLSPRNSSPSHSTSNDASSIDNLRLDEKQLNDDSDDMSDAARIIIYKILDKKSDKKLKMKKKHSKKSINFANKENPPVENAAAASEKVVDFIQPRTVASTELGATRSVTPQHIKEGVYKIVSQKGDNLSSMAFVDALQEPTPSKTETVNRSHQDIAQPQLDAERPQEYTKQNQCGCNNQETGNSQRPHTASTCSFKTASNLKGRQNVEAKPEESAELPTGGYVKVVDENGQESGKFFIGASGFLKDNDYEVVIQLRKTDTNKISRRSTTSEFSTTTHQKEQQSNYQNALPINRASAEDERPKSNEEIKSTEKNCRESNKINEEPDIKNDGLTDKPVPLTKQTYFIDKGVDAYLLNPKDTEVKLATSVSVQTTLDSPERRYYRMSSSTSTTYMSPPEVILPTVMTRESRDKHFAYQGPLDSKVYFLNEVQPKSKKISRPTPVLSPSKQTQHVKNFKTPPSSARSSCNQRYTPPCKKKVGLTMSLPKTSRKVPYKCLKHHGSKSCCKSYNRKIRLPKTLSNPIAPPPSLENIKSHRFGGNRIRDSKYFNPIMKLYVDKLLMMNEEGVKAVNVFKQECSSVPTPGSSIIDDHNNIDKGEPKVQPKISLEQLKQLIAQHIVKKITQDLEARENGATMGDTGLNENGSGNVSLRFPKKRSVHKVKSLNISKHLFSKKSNTDQKPMQVSQSSDPGSSTSSRSSDLAKRRSKSSPSPRRAANSGKTIHRTNSFELMSVNDLKQLPCVNEKNSLSSNTSLPSTKKSDVYQEIASLRSQDNKAAAVPCSVTAHQQDSYQPSLHTSTQTSQIDEQIHYIKLAEDKIQNMEKIADLTEKCTKRLSNLAKVLDEVRKNKLSYSRGSESASDTDLVSGKNFEIQQPAPTYEPIVEVREKEYSNSQTPQNSERSPEPPKKLENLIPEPPKKLEHLITDNKKCSPKYQGIKSPPNRPKSRSPTAVRNSSPSSSDHHHSKSRGKPPPALVRRCLKRTQEYIIPHELSTVVEIDSPINSKHKRQSAQNNTNVDWNSSDIDQQFTTPVKNNPITEGIESHSPDLLENNAEKQNHQASLDPTAEPERALEDSKTRMMDLKQFNEIMLKPFISIQEYAKQCNIEKLDEGSNLENTHLPVSDVINDEISSLHSDGSLPDVVAELLKRHIISEPFKFDTISNVNSTTASSDSTFSVLALSKVKKGKKERIDPLSNKENMDETSDTLSMSSNPDLEKAFKKLGMGWASSTLKKTKEHLALSSSSTNTSSSSLSQYKLKKVCKDFPALVTDSISSMKNGSNMVECKDQNISANPVNVTDNKKSVCQQTSKANNSLTVKQFLTTELAKRITFGDKSSRNETEEFISMYETKMPEDMMNKSKRRGDRSVDSNQRARTSTPVQIFKSTTYNSSTSSNLSNGFFSNVEELSSVKGTSNSLRNHSTSEKDDLTIPNFSLRPRKGYGISDCSRSDD